MWKPCKVFGILLSVKCVSLPILLYVSGPVITVEDVTGCPADDF